MTDHDEIDLPDPIGPAADVVRATWAAVLGQPTIAPDVGFFDLGAVSADVLVVVGCLRARWPRLRVVDVFVYPTVDTLAAFLDRQFAGDG
jgi:hypothetical protein